MPGRNVPPPTTRLDGRFTTPIHLRPSQEKIGSGVIAMAQEPNPPYPKIAYPPPATSTAYTCVAPCMLERNTTHLLSGVIVTFGSSA
jgi:hypothetical protein